GTCLRLGYCFEANESGDNALILFRPSYCLSGERPASLKMPSRSEWNQDRIQPKPAPKMTRPSKHRVAAMNCLRAFFHSRFMRAIRPCENAHLCNTFSQLLAMRSCSCKSKPRTGSLLASRAYLRAAWGMVDKFCSVAW